MKKEIELKVHQNTIDEYTLYGVLENNIESDNLIVMIHSGGMDLHECGKYVTFDKDGKVYKENGKTVWNQNTIGNYDIISNHFKDYAIFRYDLRNHGKSLKLSYLDKRPTSHERFTSDLDEMLDYVLKIKDYKNIIFIGTCIGALLETYYLLKEPKYINKVKALIFNSSLNNYEITNRTYPSLAYKTNEKIFNEGGIVQVLDSTFSDITTYNYALDNLDVGVKFGKLLKKHNIKLLYAYSINDRFIYKDHYKKYLEDIKENAEVEELVLSNEKVNGIADHCFWNPESGEYFTKYVINYIENLK